MVQTEKLSFQYGKGTKRFKFPDLHLKPQENLLVLGKSGIGKTTFLHLLAGLLTPESGKVIIANKSLSNLKDRELDFFRGAHIGFVFQKKHAIPSLSVLENLKARLFFSKCPIHLDEITELLEQLNLKEAHYQTPKELSEGQLQRLSIALAVIHKPKLLLADEPTASLDDENCALVMNLLLQQATKTKANLIVITHDARVKPFFENAITL